MKQETQAYNKYITNPFNTLPKTMPQNHSQRSLTEFLKKNRDMITPNREGHLIVDGKKISEDPHDVGRIIHYLTRDIRGPAPKGIGHVMNALRKRGFDIDNDIGNVFLKEKLKRRGQKTKDGDSGISSGSSSKEQLPRRGRKDPGDDDDNDEETPKQRRRKKRYRPYQPSSATPAQTRSKTSKR